MTDFVLFGSVTYFILSILVFLIVLFICEGTKSGIWAFSTFIILNIGYHYFSNFNIFESFSWSRFGIYFGVGLLFSFIRCYFYAIKIKNHTLEFADDKNRDDRLHNAKVEIKRELKGNVFRWWFMWPASLLYWIFSDLVADFFSFVYKRVANIFNGIVDYAFK